MEWWREMRTSIVDAEWESSAHDECSCHSRGSNGKIVGLTTCVNDTFPADNDEQEIWRMVGFLLRKYEGRDSGVPDKIVGMNIQVVEWSIPLDQALYTKGIAHEGMGSIDLWRCHPLLDPGMYF